MTSSAILNLYNTFDHLLINIGNGLTFIPAAMRTPLVALLGVLGIFFFVKLIKGIVEVFIK